MRSVPSLSLILGIFALLSFHNSSFASAADPANQNFEEIILTRDNVGYYFTARVGDGSFPSQARMMLSLTNSQILFSSQSCPDVFSFNTFCPKPSETAPSKVIEHPSFSATAQSIPLVFRINSVRWDQKKEVLLATECDSGQDSFRRNRFAVFRDGMFGMGTENSSATTTSQIFSIYLDSTGGRLLFYFAQTFSKPNPPIVLSTDSRWQVSGEKISLAFGDGSLPLSGKIHFDVNTDDIILPLNIWSSLIEVFRKSYSRCWEGGFHLIRCEKRKIPEIPPLRILIDDNIIEIPSRIFTTDEGYQTDRFDLKASNTSTLNPGFNPVYVLPSFKDSIILGARFMKFYYPVFKTNQSSNTVELYQKIDLPPAPKPDPKLDPKQPATDNTKQTQTKTPDRTNIGLIVELVFEFGLPALIVIISICHWLRKKIPEINAQPSQYAISDQSYQIIRNHERDVLQGNQYLGGYETRTPQGYQISDEEQARRQGYGVL